MAMNPHWLRGFPAGRDAGGTVRTGLQVPRIRRARTPGMRRSAGCAGGSGSCRPTRWWPGPAVRSRRAQDTGQNAVKVRENARRGQRGEDRGRVPTEVQRGRQNAGSRAPLWVPMW